MVTSHEWPLWCPLVLDSATDPLYDIVMKAIQVTIDEDTLTRFDADEEVRAVGRSAVIRSILVSWLSARREQAIRAAYQRGYADRVGLGQEWEGWEEQGEWPDK